MNIVSTMVGLTMMGAAAPAMVNMTLTPIIAQKRTNHLTQAEATAVAFAATAEADQALPNIPTGCSVSDPKNTVYTITCVSGVESNYGAVVSRSFRIIPEAEGSGSGGRTFLFETPERFSGHQCPQTDQWGVYGYNEANAQYLGGACIPRAIWNVNKYEDSNPDAWLYDVNNHNGWGYHSNY